MTFGYLTVAINSNDNDYVRMAYAAALSLSLTQKSPPSYSIIVDHKQIIPERYMDVFDQIIRVDSSKYELDLGGSKDTTCLDWMIAYLTPYDETVLLDADMLFFSDITDWWNCIDQDICFTSSILTYKGEITTSDEYRRAFTFNELPNLYTAMMYFRKSSQTSELFRMIELIMKDWKIVYEHMMTEANPSFCSSDVVYSLAVKMLGIEDQVISPNGIFPTFVHMKSRIQNWNLKNISEDWTIYLRPYLEKIENKDIFFRLGQFRQFYPLHYHRKEILTDEIIKKLESFK